MGKKSIGAEDLERLAGSFSNNSKNDRLELKPVQTEGETHAPNATDS